MNNTIKNIFSIKDLENLSGIKAHTIRIWEKRYNVLQPMRTDTNIRFYNLANLQKLLNITLLHSHGYKISKIATYSEERIPALVREIMSDKSAKSHAINAFKMAMINFDQTLFSTTYDRLLSEKSFRDVFHQVFIPLLDEIGMLWQTDTITPAHEHFISNLIRQKILTNTEKIQMIAPTRSDRIFVLFLPENEIHEIGLLYLNYEITLQGFKAIYLGASVPHDSLATLKKYFDNITFVTYFTISPVVGDINDYISTVSNQILEESSELWILGRMAHHARPQPEGSQVKLFTSILEVSAAL